MDQIKFRKGSEAYALASRILDLAKDANGRVTMSRLDAALIEVGDIKSGSRRAARRLQRGRLQFSKRTIRYLFAFTAAVHVGFYPKKAWVFADGFIGLCD